MTSVRDDCWRGYGMAGAFRAAVIRAIPWLLFGSVLLPAAGSAVAGILVLVFWRQAGDIALGVLVIVMGLAVIAGTFTSLGLLLRQNRMARAQADFIAFVSHELRTPMASIRMGIETLRDERFHSEDERREFLQMLEIESRRLSSLVEKAVGYELSADRESGKAARNAATSGCASELVKNALAGILASPATKDSVVLLAAHDIKGPCNDNVSVDFDAFAGAVVNMVSNALTHGRANHEKPVRVGIEVFFPGVRLHEVLAPFGEVVISVADQGPGVASDETSMIFDRFCRGKAASQTDVPGLGLGLSIVRGFARASGGIVTVEDTPGGGATFRLTLPAHQADSGKTVDCQGHGEHE